MKNATNTMLCWTPNTDKVALVPWPDKNNLSSNYERSVLACFEATRKASSMVRRIQVLIEFVSLVTRDGCDPKIVHKVMLELEEYKSSLTADFNDDRKTGVD